MDHVVGFSLIPEFQGRIRRGVAWADEDIPVVEVFGVNIVAIKHGVPDQEFIVAVTYAHGGVLFTLAFVGIHFQRDTDLFEVIHAACATRRFPCPGEGGE